LYQGELLQGPLEVHAGRPVWTENEIERDKATYARKRAMPPGTRRLCAENRVLDNGGKEFAFNHLWIEKAA